MVRIPRPGMAAPIRLFPGHAATAAARSRAGSRVEGAMTEVPPPLATLARYAIMIDVGYIYAAAGELLFSAGSRREYRVDADKLIQALTRHADDKIRGELLRVYWYRSEEHTSELQS